MVLSPQVSSNLMERIDVNQTWVTDDDQIHASVLFLEKWYLKITNHLYPPNLVFLITAVYYSQLSDTKI